MKDNNEKLNDKELENVMGAGDYIEFIDSDDYEEKETYETAYKYGKKSFADAVLTTDNIVGMKKSLK